MRQPEKDEKKAEPPNPAHRKRETRFGLEKTPVSYAPSPGTHTVQHQSRMRKMRGREKKRGREKEEEKGRQGC